ncbi:MULTISPECIES: tRNA(Met) cytidine acetyltransferase TmcA [Proteus]|uniref:tRNA(Met) cytidine acetyltransferase TmcA n=1 Tax=Proteus TaxID=583 RepID=UPI000502895C|nr:GNAT family N-acetyltransferase [Proteus vulgaris]MBI6509811.1 tRNA(Met) cytidine acetyltransferase [Proteus sp. PR00174]NBN47166.1 GNAT family N-acetyltransferase [Proteus sp. G2626]NBN60547.1 GNAT family N-acetyltransferase [Proteus sp. G2639]NBN76580.1 GNAT family N-acetyltransferase [Proteus sp. G2615]NBN86630.1 GNAT family N-acetyltransferase [Proteus sp. G2300]RNT28780.1 tRNA(Met) cytidine acetyltransferase [Proteus mirabilis]
MPFSRLHQYQQKLAQLGRRQLLLLAGDPTWQTKQIQQITQLCQGDWITISSNKPNAILPEHAIRLLGREFLHAVFDANEGFNADALAMLTGTLKAGSLLILCLPNVERWDNYIDNDSQRWNDAQDVLSTPNFMTWLKNITFSNNQVVIWQQSTPLELPTLIEMDGSWSLPQGEPTKEQQTILANLLASPSGVWSIIAPRGRGKSALAGMFIEQYHGSVIVCAPAKNSTDVLSSHTNKTVSFYSPDTLLALCINNEIQSDWLIIDEAASLPIAQLETLCRYFPSVLMTTTVQGYEGTGRGFMLKLGVSIPNLHTYQLQTPIRWAKDCPLENWLNQLLLLDEVDCDFNRQQKGEVTIHQHQGNWHNKFSQLRSFYQLLTGAHYRTTPLDLRRLLDGQRQHYWSALINQKNVGAVWCIEEGGLSFELALDVWRGSRRPRGNLVAQSLVTYGLTPDAMCLTSLRISRIAVLPQYRRQKIGANLIEHIVNESQKQNIDYLSVSFGYTKMLAQFWLQCGFQIVRLGIHKEASSGCYSAMAIYPITEKGEQLLQSSLKSFSLQYQHIKEQTGICLSMPSLSHDIATQQDSWLMMAGFAFAHRPVVTVYESVANFLVGYEQHYPLLVAFFVENKTVEQCVAEFSLSGKKVLTKQLRDQCAKLMAEKDPQLTSHYQQWLATYSHPSCFDFV